MHMHMKMTIKIKIHMKILRMARKRWCRSGETERSDVIVTALDYLVGLVGPSDIKWWALKCIRVRILMISFEKTCFCWFLLPFPEPRRTFFPMEPTIDGLGQLLQIGAPLEWVGNAHGAAHAICTESLEGSHLGRCNVNHCRVPLNQRTAVADKMWIPERVNADAQPLAAFNASVVEDGVGHCASGLCQQVSSSRGSRC